MFCMQPKLLSDHNASKYFHWKISFLRCKNEFLILLKFPSYKYFRFIHISHIISLHNCMCRYISSNKCIFELLFFFVTQCLHVNFLKCLLFSIYQHQTRKCSYIFTLSVLRYISSVIYPPWLYWILGSFQLTAEKLGDDQWLVTHNCQNKRTVFSHNCSFKSPSS